MEEPVGAQYAVHIAMHTLKDRCKKLQQRVSSLEEENLDLRRQSRKQPDQNEDDSMSVPEADRLKQQITELTEQKNHLLTKIKMVSAENQELWNKLGKLTHVNQSLGTQLNKINDSLTQHAAKTKEGHSPLIRSKTFTQDEPHTKVLQKNLEESGRIGAELDEISLKIINTFTQGRNDLDSLYSELTEAQYNDNVITDSFGFYYDDFDNDSVEEFNSLVEELRTTKEVVSQQRNLLQVVLVKVNNLQEAKTKCSCDTRDSRITEKLDKSTSTQTTVSDKNGEPSTRESVGLPESGSQGSPENGICPICCKKFYKDPDFSKLQSHVEKHFTDDTFELL